MSAGYTHYIFAKEVYELLDSSLQERIKPYMDYYHIGLHGPDILFYHEVYHSNPIKSQGFKMHDLSAYPFFMEAKQLIKQSSNPEAALAYILGFITHFTLDSELHPYIGQQEKELQLTHSEIESQCDRELLVRNGLDPLSTSLTTHIHPTEELSSIIAPFFKLEGKDIYKSLKWLLFILECIRAPKPLKRKAVLKVMKLTGFYDEYEGLLISYQPNKKTEECVRILLEKKDNAKYLAVYLMNEFMTHLHDQELNERFNRTYE